MGRLKREGLGSFKCGPVLDYVTRLLSRKKNDDCCLRENLLGALLNRIYKFSTVRAPVLLYHKSFLASYSSVNRLPRCVLRQFAPTNYYYYLVGMMRAKRGKIASRTDIMQADHSICRSAFASLTCLKYYSMDYLWSTIPSR